MKKLIAYLGMKITQNHINWAFLFIFAVLTYNNYIDLKNLKTIDQNFKDIITNMDTIGDSLQELHRRTK